jgi:hypothetical protein
VSVASVQDLRRIVEAVSRLRGCTVQDVEIRTDCRALRVTLDDGQILLISVLLDDAGKPRLDVDLLHPLEGAEIPGQLEVRFDGAPL